MARPQKRPLFTDLDVLFSELDNPLWRSDRQIVQLVDDWHSFPHTRQPLIESALPEDAEPVHVTKAAAVLHALCDDAGLKAPPWVHGQRADPEYMLFGVPIQSEYAHLIQMEAPNSCKEHGVWFDYRSIRPKREGLVNPLAGMSLVEYETILGTIDG